MQSEVTVGSLFAGIGGFCYSKIMPKGVYPHNHIKPKTYPPELVDRVKDLYASNMTQAEVGAVLGLSQRVIWRIMHNHSIPARVAIKRNQTGPANSTWKGNRAGYAALHKRVEATRGKPSICERCGSNGDTDTIYEWANLTGIYEDVGDYERMCRSCHRRYDNSRRQGGDA